MSPPVPGTRQANCTVKQWYCTTHCRELRKREDSAHDNWSDREAPVSTGLCASWSPRRETVFLPLCGLHFGLVFPQASLVLWVFQVVSSPPFPCQYLSRSKITSLSTLSVLSLLFLFFNIYLIKRWSLWRCSLLTLMPVSTATRFLFLACELVDWLSHSLHSSHSPGKLGWKQRCAAGGSGWISWLSSFFWTPPSPWVKQLLSLALSLS